MTCPAVGTYTAGAVGVLSQQGQDEQMLSRKAAKRFRACNLRQGLGTLDESLFMTAAANQQHRAAVYMQGGLAVSQPFLHVGQTFLKLDPVSAELPMEHEGISGTSDFVSLLAMLPSAAKG